MSELLRTWKPGGDAWNRAAILHLYRRAGFGASQEELERASSEGLEPTLERLFEDRTPGELNDSIQPLLAADSLELLQAWWMARILAGTAPLRERMTLVWHDLFATSHDKVGDVRLMHGQNELLRRGALGDYRALLHGVARDPAMLVWLDGNSNRKGQPNENFAREVMELFALGKGNYGEGDVREAARAFSGWSTAGRRFVLAREHHDDSAKTLFGRTGQWDGDQAIDLILDHPACVRHVARVLLEAFVAPTAQPEWVTALAEVVTASAWEMEPVLLALLRSELFFSTAARRSRIAAPVECLAVASRAIGARLAPRAVAQHAGAMGQALFRPPSVAGWNGGRAWIHSGHWIARHNALVALATSADLSGWQAGETGQAFARRVLDGLLPEDPPRLQSSLESWTRSGSGAPEERHSALALVLSSPEFQLF